MGFLHEASADAYAATAPAFAEGLSQEGFVEAQNLALEYRFAEGRTDRLPAMANDLVRRDVALIVAAGARAAITAASATATIPVVFVTGFDPVALGLVANLGRPSGNVTGVTFITAGLSDERLDLLGQLLPRGKRIGYLGEKPADQGPISRAIEDLKSEMLMAAGRRGYEVVVREVGTERDYAAAFMAFDNARVDAVVVAPSLIFANDADDIIGIAASHEIPALYPRRADVVAGGLISYGAHLGDAWRGCGLRVGEVLGGAAPSDAPVVRTTGLELVISRLIAKSLDIEVPASLLARAEVLE